MADNKLHTGTNFCNKFGMGLVGEYTREYLLGGFCWVSTLDYPNLLETKGSFGKAPAPASLAPDPDPREELILLILLENQNRF
jgi:hypothetical protein